TTVHGSSPATTSVGIRSSGDILNNAAALVSILVVDAGTRGRCGSARQTVSPLAASTTAPVSLPMAESSNTPSRARAPPAALGWFVSPVSGPRRVRPTTVGSGGSPVGLFGAHGNPNPFATAGTANTTANATTTRAADAATAQRRRRRPGVAAESGSSPAASVAS